MRCPDGQDPGYRSPKRGFFLDTRGGLIGCHSKRNGRMKCSCQEMKTASINPVGSLAFTLNDANHTYAWLCEALILLSHEKSDVRMKAKMLSASV